MKRNIFLIFCFMVTDKREDKEKSEEKETTEEKKCVRFVFFTDLESCYDDIPQQIHYYRACKEFYQRLNQAVNPALPRKVTARPWESLRSVVHLTNQKLARQFEEQREKFWREEKLTEHGRVEEILLYHGSSPENIDKIASSGFCLDSEPEDGGRRKLMLFGRGVYLSPLPGVCMMYGEALLLCRVLLGRCEKYFPNGAPPPPLAEHFDSRKEA